ncbi:uncharacterized protein MONBRDRAFT_29238 [Monosiga brevicollis MX1]|uniref:Phytanoyl-CoA dioxygenase n=1 Tax=Monosiga brevicollis TaxID=81824 RepID=A9VAI5_MONBE|nr:uncharacterized protein MONBRDRAFT_29238 [Monosiga brevicollis MX1]EDQ85546.1 predicted protein [Monosiga brevicollis MX1]|eukprot:XP_001749737.1 hypothetical protein [Monosiga brevicollis MX1]
MGGRGGGVALQRAVSRRLVRLKGSQHRYATTQATGDGAYRNEAAVRGMVSEQVPMDICDLSTIHHPLGALDYQLPSQPADFERYKLSPTQLEHYWQHGFVANIPVLSEADCDRLCEELAAFQQPDLHPGHGLFHEFHRNQSGDPNNVLMHCLGHWRIQKVVEHHVNQTGFCSISRFSLPSSSLPPSLSLSLSLNGFHDLIFHPAITVPSAQLIAGEGRSPTSVRFWHDQLFCKPAAHGGNVAYHQDYSYWTRTTPMQHLTVHVALDDQSPENGAITYIPDMDSIKTVLEPDELARFEPVTLRLRRGEAVIHHPLSVHGSFGNRSPRPRRAAVVNFLADGTLSDSDDPLLGNTPPVARGQPVRGQFFPVVLDATHLS